MQAEWGIGRFTDGSGYAVLHRRTHRATGFIDPPDVVKVVVSQPEATRVLRALEACLFSGTFDYVCVHSVTPDRRN